MVTNCEQVWRDVSNYLDGEVEPGLRAGIDDHISGCQRCAAVVNGTRNVVELYGDERMSEVPLGFGYRLHQRLDEDLARSRRGFLGWMVAAAAAVLVFASIETVRSAGRGFQLRSQMAQPGNGVPPDLPVVVAEQGKLFHTAGCEFIRRKSHLGTITAEQATLEGYTPCVRCLGKYLNPRSEGVG